MTETTLPESAEKTQSAYAQSTGLPDETVEGRDLRAKRTRTLSVLTDRRTLLGAANALTLAALDLLLLFVSLVFALRFKVLVLDEATTFKTSVEYAKNVLPFAALVMLLLFSRDGLYRPRRLRPGSAQILGSLFKVTVVTLIFALIEGERFTSYYIFWGTLLFSTVLIVGARWLYDQAAASLGRSFGVKHRAVIVGSGSQIETVTGMLKRSPGTKIEPVGFISLTPRPENGLRDFGSIDQIEERFDEIDEVIIVDPRFPQDRMVMLVDLCHSNGVRLRVAPSTMEVLRADDAEFIPGETLPLFEIKAPVLEGVDFLIKRGFDFIVSALLLVLLSPLLLLIAAAVKLTSRGSVFYRAPRPGLGGESFECFKFRTMVSDADALQDELEEMNEADGAIFKIREDPRLTPIGGFLRRWSLDELPQLINVLKGEMSLVGPRPLPGRDYDRLEDWHKKRYLVLPGLSGLWQVNGRSDLDFDDLVRLDFLYIERWSIFLDIVILLRTIPAVLVKRGAY